MVDTLSLLIGVAKILLEEDNLYRREDRD